MKEGDLTSTSCCQCDIRTVIHELIRWIELNLMQPLSVNDVVMKSGYSSFYLQRSFTSVTGESVGRYIRRRRLEVAARLLRETHADVSEIALMLGFDEITSFYRSFKRTFGISPGRYRGLSNANLAEDNQKD